ncbi:MAG: VWA domain-containing protein [Anaerolineae bacterium]|nr:VWA domain-containing protein [Anaerolineae bacterium]
MAEITLQNPWALLALPPLWLLLLAFAWRRRFKPFGAFLLRLAILILLVVALSRPVFVPPAAASERETPERQILLVDQSASLGLAGQQALRAEAARLAQESPHTVTVYFADRPFILDQSAPPFEGSSASFDPTISNLASALTTGQQLLNGQPGRLVLLSDGLANQGDTNAAITRLVRQNIPVDVLLADESTRQNWRGSPNEVSLVKLTVPPALRQGETFNLEVTLHSLAAAQVTLNVAQGDTTLAEDVVSLEPGPNLFTFEATAEETGPQTFEAAIAPAEGADAQAANNRLAAFTQVYLPPQILVVSNEAGPAGQLALQLRQAGFVVERAEPADLPTRLSALDPYDGIVLANVSARALELEQMIALQEFVRSLGRGLVITAGRDSFALGAYEDTPLADLLPVTLEPPAREERPPVALLLIIDHSGSMLELSEPATKLAMAKEAAIRATDILGPQDLIGVLMFDNAYEWVVPFQRVSDGAELLTIQRNIATIQGGGGTRVLQALTVGLPELAAQEVGSAARHAVLLTDGKSFDGIEGLEAYDMVVDAALEADITLSTIAIGADSDQELLTYLAERGRGRYHYAAVPDELPELTVAESDILRSNAIQEGEFRPTVFAPHPILRGLFSPNPEDAAELPDLSGYLAQTPKPRAEVALQAGPGDPVLSVWGYGLGRVAAWTSDIGEEWATSWQRWPEASRFWGQIVGYTLPAPGLGLLQLQADVEPGSVVVLTAEGLTATGQTVELARTEAILTTPAGREIPVMLRQIAPGRYQQRLRLPDPGAYQVTVTQERGNEPQEVATTGFIVPYPAEYSLPFEGTGTPLLQRIAEATGGRTFALGEQLQVRGTGCKLKVDDCEIEQTQNTETASFIENLQSKIQNLKSEIELWPWLLLAALVLWPIEIAWRRWGRLRIQ